MEINAENVSNAVYFEQCAHGTRQKVAVYNGINTNVQW